MVVVVSRKTKLTPAEEAQARASALVEEQYQNFDVVWAKLGSFPWWPGVLFYSWDAVIDAGLELKQVQNQLVIPPPTTQVLPDGKQRTTYSVLIMYLDKFDCSVVEVSPKTVCPFAINYHRLKERPKGKNGTGFNVALERALRLLHMNNHMTLEELDAIAPIRIQPTEEELAESQSQQQLSVRSGGGKRQKRTHTSHAAAKHVVHVEDLEDEDEEDEDDDVDFGSDYTDDEDHAEPSANRGKTNGKKPSRTIAMPKAVSKKASAKVSQRVLDLSAGGKKASVARGKHAAKRKSVHHAEAIDDDDGDDSDFEIVNTLSHKAPAKPASSRKKASRKEGRIHHDVINIDEDEDDEERNTSDDDFQISIAHPSSKKVRSVPAKIKLPKHSKTKADEESVVIIPAKLKKNNKTKTILLDPEVAVVPVAKPMKKRGPKPKRQSHHDHDASHGPSVQVESRSAESSPVQQLTLTPLSTIWTTRETSTAPADDKVNAENFARLAYKLDLLWDEAVFSDEIPRSVTDADLPDAGDTASGAVVSNERGVGKRQVRSVQQSQIRQSMLTGNLDPHTMVQCEAYLPKGGGAIIDSGNSRSRGAAPQIEAPFDVVVHPDVAFVCDLHSHLATCEIIGFLGGRWDDATKTLYIQAAFPCRSLEIEGDDGSTDVEMDPGSEIELREIIQNAELEVVGWYHSHPAFAPDPSIRDIENQTSYQQLFQRTKHLDGGKTVVSYPFVGLIVGTYDQRRESPVGLFRYFHTREERLNSGMRGAVHMPYELVPRKRHYRSVLEDEKQDQLRRLPLYVSVAETLFGADKTVFVKSPRLPNDEAELQARNKHAKNMNVAVDGRKKRRKSSSDIALLGSDESVPQPVKKKRGRLKGWKKALAATAQVVEDEAAPEVIDLVTDTSQELSQSQEPAIPTNQIAGTSIKKPTMADPGGRSYSGGARRELQESVKGMGVKMPAADGQHSSSTQVPPTSSSVQTDDVVMVDESSPSQLEHRKVLQVHGDDGIAVVEPDGSAQGVVTGTLCSDEVICDSSQSQDTTSVCCADGSRADRSLKSGASPTTLVTNHEDVVPASASSSSSRSESSFSYDASQSQPTSQSQVCSHPDDMMTANEIAKTTGVEDDPFAGIEILPNEPSLSSAPPPDAFLKHADPAKAVNAAEVASERPASSDVAGSTSSRNTQLLDETKDHFIKQDDEVVGDSGPDVNSQSIPGRDETKIAAGGGAVQQTLVDDQPAVGENAASGGSTPIDGFTSAGRRRTRKPSLTVRRQSGAGASPVWTNVSPRSPGITAKVEGDRDREKIGDGSKVKSYEEVTVTMSDTVLVAPERKLAVDSGWDDVEIISVDYMDSSRPVKIEMTPPESVEAESAVKVIEPDASERLKSEKHSTCVGQVEVQEQEVGTGNRDLKEMQPAYDVQVTHKLKAEDSMPAALPAPRHSSDFVEASPIPSDEVAVATDSQTLRPTSVAGGRGRRSKCIDVVDDAGFLEEPLDRYKAILLRSATQRLGLLKKMPSTDRNKEGYIAAIRAHWDELLHQPSPDVKSVEAGATDSLPPPTSTLDTVEENDEMAILDEARDVIRALVSNVESLVADVVPSSAATNQPDPGTMKADDSAPATTEISVMKSDETLTTPAPKPEIRDPAQASGPSIEAPPTQVVAPAASSTYLSGLTKTKPTRQDRRVIHLQALRTEYTRGVYGCTEQVITLIDYYRDFHRRTDLYDVWKGKILKVDKIQASLRADVEHVNLPVALRDAFIKDVMGYLCASWKSSRPMK